MWITLKTLHLLNLALRIIPHINNYIVVSHTYSILRNAMSEALTLS